MLRALPGSMMVFSLLVSIFSSSSRRCSIAKVVHDIDCNPGEERQNASRTPRVHVKLTDDNRCGPGERFSSDSDEQLLKSVLPVLAQCPRIPFEEDLAVWEKKHAAADLLNSVHIVRGTQNANVSGGELSLSCGAWRAVAGSRDAACSSSSSKFNMLSPGRRAFAHLERAHAYRVAEVLKIEFPEERFYSVMQVLDAVNEAKEA
jgi:hypothetical protein